jgi:hypothetical protein
VVAAAAVVGKMAQTEGLEVAELQIAQGAWP